MGSDAHEPALVSAWGLLGASGVGCVRTFFRVRVGKAQFGETSRLGVRARDFPIERLPPSSPFLQVLTDVGDRREMRKTPETPETPNPKPERKTGKREKKEYR